MMGNETNAGAPCPICASSETFALAEASNVPILMNRLYATADSARAARSASLRLTRCARCGFTWNRDFRPELIVYDEAYENDQAWSGVFQAHIEGLANDVIAAAEPLRYLEIGCGQGGFIGVVAKRAGSRLASAEGFDPAWRGADGGGPFGARIHKSYFTRASLEALEHEPNVIVSRHTIEHVPDPVAFLGAIRDALGPRAEATIFLETPCVDWILRHDAMQDFFYEHCSLFTARALALALERAGFHSPRVEHVFGGQYLWARAGAGATAPGRETPEPLRAGQAASRREAFVAHWRERAAKASSRGRCAIWGAGAKGVTFALMMDAAQPFDHVVDINPAKQGLHLAGSGLRVLSPEQSAARGVATYFVMNPNYCDEIAARLAALGAKADLVALDGGAQS
jgi:SAM-dependent methyltransferase